MNVAFDPWIPVVTATGKPDLASLSDVLIQGEKYLDLSVRPHERVALMRLFICVAHAALDGPKDYTQWCNASKCLLEAVIAYLNNWRDSFELFHPDKPWLQVPLSNNITGNVSTDKSDDWIPVSKLNFSFATGSNSTIFDHEGMLSYGREISPQEMLVSMISFQCFSVGGLIGQVFWNGQRCGELANPKKENGPVKSSDGPCVPSSMIHALLRGANIKETIVLNLPAYDLIQKTYGKSHIGRPVWEMMPTSLRDQVRVENATKTYLGRLVPITRLILIHPSGKVMLMGDGLPYPSFISGFPPEPTATVVVKKDNKSKKEERVLHSYRPSKSIWRELASIIVKRKAEGIGGPLSLNALQDAQNCDLVVSALARDKATIVDTTESVFHISSSLRSNQGNMSYQYEVKVAETMASRLGWVIEIYRKEIDQGWEGRLKAAGPSKSELKAKLHEIATRHYWTTVEKNLPLLMKHIEAIGKDEAIPLRDAWRKMLYASALEAYRLVCGRETTRQMKAFAAGWRILTSKKQESVQDVTDDKEDVV